MIACCQVMHDVARHFPYFRLSPEAKAAAEQSWYQRFSELPGGDVSKLLPERKLIWQELPLCSLSPARVTRVDAATAIDEIENPDVNPIWMRGIRSQNDVAIDYDAWVAEMENNPDAPYPPLFGGQYILVALDSRPLQLHRVLRCKAGHQYTKDVTVGTTEYTHIPAACGGFFGTFKPAVNPQYDGRGYKFLRHTHIKREQIKLYNVSTFPDPDDDEHLFLHLSALKSLSEAIPEYVLPNPIPASHRAQESGTAAAPAAAPAAARRAAPAAARAPAAQRGRAPAAQRGRGGRGGRGRAAGVAVAHAPAQDVTAGARPNANLPARKHRRVVVSSSDEDEEPAEQAATAGGEALNVRACGLAEEAGMSSKERDIVDSYAVPEGFERLARPSEFPRDCLARGLYVLMRFTRNRVIRRDGQQTNQEWCEWALGRVTKQRATLGVVDIMWDDVGRKSSKLNLHEYGGGREDGPQPTWIFCKKCT